MVVTREMTGFSAVRMMSGCSATRMGAMSHLTPVVGLVGISSSFPIAAFPNALFVNPSLPKKSCINR